MALNDTLEVIERTLYELVRLELVSEGLTPDVTTYGNTTTAYEQYQTDLKAVVTAKGWAVELFGTEASNYRGLEKVSRIVLNHNTLVPGDYGVDPTGEIVETSPGVFQHKQGSNLAMNYFIDLVIITENQKELRKLMALIFKALPVRGFKQSPIEIGLPQFLMVLDSTYRLQREKDGILGQQYTFLIPDLFMGEILEGPELAAISEIHTSIYINEHLGIQNIITT